MSGKGTAGLGVDARGGPVIDPTANVIALVQANKVSADELNAMRDRYVDAEIRVVRETVKWLEKLAEVHQKHDYALHQAEAGRLDALRQNDREDVKALAIASNQKAEVLATLLTDATNEQNKRFAAIERQQSMTSGQGTGAKNIVTYAIIAVGLLVSLITVGSVVIAIAFAIRQ